MLIPAALFPHTATVEVPNGVGPYGPSYAAPVEIRCMWQDRRRLIRTPEGREAVSMTTLVAPPGTDIPIGSRITRGGRTSTVMQVADQDGGGLPTPDHVEAMLQ